MGKASQAGGLARNAVTPAWLVRAGRLQPLTSSPAGQVSPEALHRTEPQPLPLRVTALGHVPWRWPWGRWRAAESIREHVRPCAHAAPHGTVPPLCSPRDHGAPRQRLLGCPRKEGSMRRDLYSQQQPGLSGPSRSRGAAGAGAELWDPGSGWRQQELGTVAPRARVPSKVPVH